MEDNIQTIIVVIISAFLLFIFPVYMAYEKKDDISYALAMRYTQDLVDEVRSKGYLTKNMYEDYRAKLKLTGNTYDIQMTHEYNRYDPITNYYKVENEQYVLVKTTTHEDRKIYEHSVLEEGIELGKINEQSSEKEKQRYLESVYKQNGIDKVEETYQLSKEVYTSNHIVNVLNSERKLQLNSTSDNVKCSDVYDADDGCQYAYIMNVDDNFNITIKNTNITLATVIYNMVTANTLDDNTRIYVNYGGAILANKWYANVDYAKMKHDSLSLNKFTEKIIFTPERHFYITVEGGIYPTTNKAEDNSPIINSCDGPYVLDFDVKPQEVTELKEKGAIRTADYSRYNFAIGNDKQYNNESMMSVSVGINGISLIVNETKNYRVNTSSLVNLPSYQKKIEKTRVVQEEYVYIDEQTGEEKIGLRDKVETYFEYITEQRKITDYSKLVLNYVSKGKIKVTLSGKSGVPAFEENILVIDDNNLLQGLNNIVIQNPIVNTYTGNIGQASNKRGTNVNYSINVTDTTIGITAGKYVSEELTILSYPFTINDYVNVRIELEQNKNKNYQAILFVDDEKVDESIEMETLPKISVIGKTFIGNEERFFDGYLRNIKMYN